jgi:hypothetical protein
LLQVNDLRSKALQGFARPAAATAQQSDASVSAAISTKVQQRRCQRQQLPETNSTEQVRWHSSLLVWQQLLQSAKHHSKRVDEMPGLCSSQFRSCFSQSRLCLQAHIKGVDEEYVMDQPQQRGQWLVSARLDGVLSIMTPVYPDDENLSLLLNQAGGGHNHLVDAA